MNLIPRFHIAFPVHNLESAREFYVNILGCESGRESDSWMDFNLYGHQIVAHLSPDDCSPVSTNPVDKDNIPCRHFGVILEWSQWEVLQNRIKKLEHRFLVEPKIRFKSKKGEQGTFFINDPSGNALELNPLQND